MRKQSEQGKSGARDLSRRGRTAFWLPFGVTVLTLTVFTGAILFVTGRVQNQLHEGILREDGEVLLAALNAADEQGSPADTEFDRMMQALEASNFRGKDVLGTRLFDAEGKYLFSIPKNLVGAELTPEEAEKLKAGQVLGKFYPKLDLSTQLGPEKKIVGPFLVSTIPLNVGSAQFLLKGNRVAAKLAAVDKDVRTYSTWMGLIGATVIGLALAWAFSRLNRANALLAQRQADLLRANHELSLAAKTTAVGAVTAHLIHGLKNPLTGLQLLVSTQMDEPDGGGAEWRIAADAAKRMQTMIADVVRIIQEDAADNYEVSVGEMLELLQRKVMPMAKEKGVRVIAEGRYPGKLANREANLVILALTNLIQNAIQASSPGKCVRVTAELSKGAVCFDVTDEAGGIPDSVRNVLFTPCHSTKPGGTGIGLAITKQLAGNVGGQLELVETSKQGTRFRLSIPSKLFLGEGAGRGELEESAVA